MKLSAIIITQNEQHHIQRCLESVAWVDEIIVLDSGSSDNTVAICKKFTSHVYETDWPGFGIQKQRALAKASGDWTLSIDADEYVTAELKTEIQSVIQNTQLDGVDIPRLSSYCGKWIKHSGWWPDPVLRLFKTNKAHFSADVVHERVIVEGQVGRLTSPLMHEAFVSPEEVLEKVNRYSSLGAKQLFEKGKKASLLTAIYKGAWSFFRSYFLKAGFLDGSAGLMLALSNAEGTYYKYIKLRQLHQQDNQSC
jgi:glycosyltransferase involved in cell wall biosynthesis